MQEPGARRKRAATGPNVASTRRVLLSQFGGKFGYPRPSDRVFIAFMRIFRLALITTLLLAIALPFFPPRSSRADDVYTIILKKQDEKDKTRWSLQDWLETRDRMRLMDLWLAMHTPSPYEFFLTGEYRFTDGNTLTRFNHSHLGFAAYASIFGLELDHYFSDATETSFLLGLRVFGFSNQGTNITLLGGLLDNQNPLGSSRNGALGARLSFYMTRNFGIDSSVLHLYPSTPNPAGIYKNGNRLTAGAFIDFRYLRLFGEYFNSSENLYQSGFGSGFKFFF